MAVNIDTIIGMISKGVNIIQMLSEAGHAIAPAISIVKNLIAGAEKGDMTDEELLAIEEELDKQIAKFNEPMDE